MMARLTIGQPEAVERLMAKLLYQAEAHPDWRRLLKATGRAHRQLRVPVTWATTGALGEEPMPATCARFAPP